MNKEAIRQKIKVHKRLLSLQDKLTAAESVFKIIEKSEYFINANKILLYYSLPDELPTHEFIRRWHFEKEIYLPRVNGKDLEILLYNPMSLGVGAYHIEEPQGYETVAIEDLDLIIIPAVAFDCHGNRVGRGKGYYDRLLANTNNIKIVIGYDFQLVEDIVDIEPHDVKADIIVTESNYIIINSHIH